jgi:hypothetical protein
VTQKRNENGKKEKAVCVISNHNNYNSGFLFDVFDAERYGSRPVKLVY